MWKLNVKTAVAYGLGSSLLIAVIIGVLMIMNANTLTAQLVSKIGLVFISTLLLFGHIKRQNGQLDLPNALRSAATQGLTMFLALIVIELLTMFLFNTKMAPESLVNTNLPFMLLYVIFGFELLLYTLISSLIGFQLMKTPLNELENKYSTQNQ